jgi:transcriptional regulator with XRE-family HTH domain
MFDLKAFRTQLELTQQAMADAMGMPLRSYQDIEAGKNPVRPIHEAAAKYAAWAVRDAARKKNGPLQFFLARFRSHEGQWSSPWSVWAQDFNEAVDRFYTLGSVDRSSEIHCKHLPADVGETWQKSKYHNAVIEHREKVWPD